MSKKYAEINIKECIGCGACISKCKKGALSMGPDGYPVVNRNLCNGCGKCTKARPADCIDIIKVKKKDKDKTKDKDKKSDKKSLQPQPEPEIREGIYLAPVYISSHQRQMISAGQRLD